MAEIPLVYPNHVYQPRRYKVDRIGKRLRRDEMDLPIQNSDLTPVLEEALSGSSSVSEIILRGQSFILTTSAKMESPEILSVALSSTTNRDLSSPILFELDHRDLELGPLVTVQAFTEGSSLIRLVLVDHQGTFVTVFLTDQLIPVTDEEAAVQVLRTSDYISETAVVQEVSGSELQSTMVAFTSPVTAIVALSPFLLTVDLDAAVSHVWSETQCLEDMRVRSSSLGSLFSNVSNALLGKLDQGVMDMSPTAALCLTTTANPLLDAVYCITLHSDASIRKWKLDISVSPYPLEVNSLNSSTLPLPSQWSDTRNSVSLCARLYDQTYALSVHIKTDTAFGLNEVSADNDASNCNLWVFHGTAEETSDPPSIPKVLAVPSDALSLIGMSFSPTASRCSLSVLFESLDPEHDRSSTIHLTYPPSIVSIVSSEPAIVGHGSLDKVASRERTRIRSLMLGPSLLEEMEDSTIEEILHELDSLYLKYLFRPMFPRGTGTVLPPSGGCIRRALGKLVQGRSKTKEAGMSIELETVRALYEWRRRENRKLAIAMTPIRKDKTKLSELAPNSTGLQATSPFSVYDTFVKGNDDEDDEMETDIPTEQNWEILEQKRSDEVEAHENRWRRLLLQVWEEEQMYRLPFLVKWLSTSPLLVMVRSSLTTVMEESPHNQQEVQTSWSVELDEIAIRLLSCIESDRQRLVRLHAVEQQVAMMIAQAQQKVSKGLIRELTTLARWAWSEAEDENGLNDAEHEKIEDTIASLSPEQLVAWIQATPENSTGALPGLEILDFAENSGTDGNVIWNQKQVANYQLRHSACALSLRCIDSIRRLQLSRSLLLLDMVEGSHAREAALRAYLHSVAVLWTSAQRVPMPMTAFTRKTVVIAQESPEVTSPPNKRLSYGDDAISILAPYASNETSPVDVIGIEVSQSMDSSSKVPNSPVGISIFLTRSFFRLAFSARGNIPIGKPSLLPELGALPRPKDDSIATDYPRLALRLLSPYVACSLPEDSADVTLARKESLAECLLIESHITASCGAAKARLRQYACELLVSTELNRDSRVDQQTVRNAFVALESMKQEKPVEVKKEVLAKTLQSLVQDGTSIEIRRLCDLETVKSLFTPLALGSGTSFDDASIASIKGLAQIMLHLSRVMYRLSILERHVNVIGGDDQGETPDVLLGFISNAINEMGNTFSDDVCQVLPEYSKMWSRLFHHAIIGGQWRTAYNACVKNPKSELRESNFRRLVRSMVDQGALSELLLLCTELGQRVSNVSSLSTAETGEAVDLYEISSEILADAVSRDVYTVRAASPEPSSLSDYQGALYALHASQKHWRRAAQSMDLRFLNAQKALGTKTRKIGFNLESFELRDGLIVEDLVLASVGALNSIQLVRKNAHRFLVSGEYGPYNTIPLDDVDEGNQTRQKRTRGQFGVNRDEKELDDADRLSNFMTDVELQGRAIRSIALRNLFFDRATDPSSAKSAMLRLVDSSKMDIEELFRSGYYHNGMLLAKAWGNNRKAETGSSRPDGNDLFYDSLCHLLESSLIPVSLNGVNGASRPTQNQIHFALDNVGARDGVTSFVSNNRSGRIQDLQRVSLMNAAAELVRKLTLAFSTSEMPVALDVANCFLNEGAEQIPAWLERLLTGVDTRPPNGLFAPRPSSGNQTYLGDPSALVTLYAKRGMFVEACAVVSSTLTIADREGNTRETKAACRLPEKGDIDFVPYKSIDLLWNLIDIVLSKGILGTHEEGRIREARTHMEKALEKHMALIKISEVGMRSARALK